MTDELREAVARAFCDAAKCQNVLHYSRSDLKRGSYIAGIYGDFIDMIALADAALAAIKAAGYAVVKRENGDEVRG